MALTVDITGNGVTVIDSEKSGGPMTVQLPESTLLVEGTTAACLNVSRTGTTGVTFTSNPNSAADELYDPTDRTAAPSSNTGSVVFTGVYAKWILLKTKHVNPTWYLMHPQSDA